MCYPNPTSNTVILSYHLLKNTKVSIIITNTLGQIVFQKNKVSTIGENQESIDLSTCSSGVYFICLNTDNLTTTKKVVKN
ncbi:MAG: T9SS type A sorting domain-containing protein [Flavobacterium sp.]|nr:T9SS type A sorting domain-containing protein [Flavobacterium sp.]